MKKKKGFTLIELLAVIVILAVIALIAVPQVMKILNSAKKETFVRSAEGILKASELVYQSNLLENNNEEIEIYDCNNGKCLSNKLDENNERIPFKIKGKIKEGIIKIHPQGQIEFTISDGKYCAIKHKEESQINIEDGDCSTVDLRLNGKITLSSSNGNYTYPETRTFEIIENTSGGTLTCESNDTEVATCSITDTTVTVIAGKKEGEATLTIKSLGNENYKEAQAAYLVTTTKGLLTVNASDVSVIYDGSSYGITVTSEGAIVKYGTEEEIYNLDKSPTYTVAGEYTVYYEVSKVGYNTVVGSKKIIIAKAEGKIELENIIEEIQYNKTETLQIKENISNGNINVISSNTDIVQIELNNGKIEVIGKKLGKASITVSSEETDNYNSVSKTYEVMVITAENTLKLSSTSGNFTYPETGTFEVVENISEGKLSCESSNEKVATCSITDTTVTVIPGTTEGNATLTIKSAATENYNEGKASYVVITEKGTLTSINAIGYEGIYNGKEHGISVTSADSVIKYGTEEGIYNLDESPKYTDVGTYTVYYQITKEGYTTITGYKQVIITKANNTLAISNTNGSYTYPNPGTFTVTSNPSNGTLSCESSNTIAATCSITDTTVTVIPGTTEGNVTITIKSEATENYTETTIVHTATIKKGTLNVTASEYEGIYDGQAHGITVTSNDGTIKYGTSNGTYNLNESPSYINAGTYTVYYQVTKEGYSTVSGSKNVTIQKANNALAISSTSGNYTYPNSGTFTVTNNPSNGTLSCESNNTAVAICSITDNTITVTPGTAEGYATITVKSQATENYNLGQVAHVATTTKGLLSYTVIGYEGEYDGNNHGITVTSSGATITYGLEQGNYTQTENPTYKDIGEYTIYYKIEKAGYNTITGSEKIIIKDTTLPTVSYNLAPGVYGSTQTVRITPNDANYYFMRIHVYKDNELYYFIDPTSDLYYDIVLSEEGNWRIHTIVTDKAGNESLEGNWYYQDYTIDTTLPTVSYNLAPGVYGSTQTVRITPNDANYSYMMVHIYKDGVMVDSKSILNTTETYADIILDSEGTWQVFTQVYDKAGNKQNQNPDNGWGWYYQEYIIKYDYTRDGLILFYDGYTAPQNGIWYDVSGNGNNGVLNGFDETGGWTGNSIYLNGSNYISNVNNNPLYAGEGSTPDMTVEVLFKKTTNSWGNLIGFGNIVNGDRFYMDLWTTIQEDTRAYQVFYTGSDNLSNSSYSLGWNNYPLNSIVKITYLKSGTTYKTYVDGILMDTKTINNPQGFYTNEFFIGKASNGYYFTGDVYSVRVYNKALTDQEILINNNLDKERFGF